MTSYRTTADPRDRAKAIAGVVIIHAALAALILSGFNVGTVRRAVEHLSSITFVEPPPPAEIPVRPSEEKAVKEAGAPAKKAAASPIVAPPTKLPVQSPIPAATVAGTGNAPTSGASTSGTGTGAGGTGNGTGGGDGGYTPARRVGKIPDREYRRLAATGIASGSVGVTIRANPDGSVSDCRVARSSGDRGVDSLMCDLALRYVRFDPARDPSGRPIGQDVTFFPNWWRP